MKRLLPAVVAILTTTACHEESSPPAPAPAAKQAPGGAGQQPPQANATASAFRTPRANADYPTTDGALALHNLSSQLDGQLAVAAKAAAPDPLANAVALLELRGQLTGSIADYEHALVLAEQLVKKFPERAMSWVTHAQAVSTFHRFDEALADYAHAEKLGTHTVELVGAREDIAASRGEDDRALAYREKMAKELPGLTTFSALAMTAGERGDLTRARALFADAQDSYRNISPFAVARLYWENGMVEERIGSKQQARALFEASHERLPCFVEASSHLADLLDAAGERDRAIALMREVIKTSDDPEFVAQLSELLRKAGKSDEATALRKQAADRYEALIKKYPLAFADHMARFLLLPGGDAKRALSFAQMNLKNRATVEAQELAIESAVAAGDSAFACKVADALTGRSVVLPSARAIAAKAYAACGRKDRAPDERTASAAKAK